MCTMASIPYLYCFVLLSLCVSADRVVRIPGVGLEATATLFEPTGGQSATGTSAASSWPRQLSCACGTNIDPGLRSLPSALLSPCPACSRRESMAARESPSRQPYRLLLALLKFLKNWNPDFRPAGSVRSTSRAAAVQRQVEGPNLSIRPSR